MTLRELLRSEISRKHSNEIAKMTRENAMLFDELWALAVSDEVLVNWRAAWVIKRIWEESPELVSPHLSNMRRALARIKQDGVKREFLKMILENPLPDDEEELGILLKYCYDWLASPLKPIAVRAHSMEILFQISVQIPAITPELKTTIEVAMQEGSAGMVSRGRKILKALQKAEKK